MKPRDKKNKPDLIVEIINAAEDGIGSADIYRALKQRLRGKPPGFSTFQRKLAELVEEGTIIRTGKALAVKYLGPVETPGQDTVVVAGNEIPVSDEGKAVRDYVRRPRHEREPAGYEPEFLEDYIPNHTCYLLDTIRRDLFLIGEIKESDLPAGSTYNPETVNRLLVDLSWTSSRLEGNTYSQLDAQIYTQKVPLSKD